MDIANLDFRNENLERWCERAEMTLWGVRMVSGMMSGVSLNIQKIKSILERGQIYGWKTKQLTYPSFPRIKLIVVFFQFCHLQCSRHFRLLHFIINFNARYKKLILLKVWCSLMSTVFEKSWINPQPSKKIHKALYFKSSKFRVSLFYSWFCIFQSS